jgi:predicted neuraminidase
MVFKVLFFIFTIGMVNLFPETSENRSFGCVKEEFLSPDIAHFDCHSSSIIETADGQYCAVWKGGPGAGKSNIDIPEKVGIWSALYEGGHWSDPQEIVSSPTSVCWTPVLCKNSLGELLLFYRMGPEPRRLVSFVKRSTDLGVGWSQGEILPAGIVGPTKNKPVITHLGALISPSSVEVGAPQDEFKATSCWIEVSEDNGHHWKKVGPLELPTRKFGVIEPALFFDTQGNLRMMCRDRANKIGEMGYIWMAVSEDQGMNWSEFKQTSLPNPDSGIDVVDLGGGKLILIYNHSHTNRSPLNLAVSLDGGDTWSQPFVLDKAGEFPSGTLSSDGLVHITYAFANANGAQRRIKHVVIDPIDL